MKHIRWRVSRQEVLRCVLYHIFLLCTIFYKCNHTTAVKGLTCWRNMMRKGVLAIASFRSFYSNAITKHVISYKTHFSIGQVYSVCVVLTKLHKKPASIFSLYTVCIHTGIHKFKNIIQYR
jgi:hypothetical protein